MRDLTTRQREVLELLVRRHRATARPVASSTLAVDGGFTWAPATLRQTMNELDDLGLLDQPHAASGRVPSDRGYRLLVDGLDGLPPLDAEEMEAIARAFVHSTRDVEQLLGQATRLLSGLARELGFAVELALDRGRLTGLELVGVAERRVLLVLTLEGGGVRSMTLDLTSALARADLDRVSQLLRERLLGLLLGEVRRRLAHDEALVRDAATALVAQACAEVLTFAARPGVFVDGASHVARHPEFSEAERLRPVLELIDHAEPWGDVVLDATGPGLQVSIGRENHRPELAHLSIVSYRLAGPMEASIGLLGPRRMDHGRAMSLVDAVGRRLTTVLGLEPHTA
jgi:heat-inducible transcriptional repressor